MEYLFSLKIHNLFFPTSSCTVPLTIQKALIIFTFPASGATLSEPSEQDVAIVDAVRSASLLRALHSCFWVQFFSIGILRLIADISAFAGPMLLNKLVGFIEDKSEDIKWGYIYALGLVITTTVCK